MTTFLRRLLSAFAPIPMPDWSEDDPVIERNKVLRKTLRKQHKAYSHLDAVSREIRHARMRQQYGRA